MKTSKKQTYHERFNRFYQSVEWKWLREQKFGDANGVCENCQKKNIIRAGREVHHVIPIEDDWSKRLDYNNLILLCPSCHQEAHNRDSRLQKFLREWENV